jgi:hypothetical protein
MEAEKDLDQEISMKMKMINKKIIFEVKSIIIFNL